MAISSAVGTSASAGLITSTSIGSVVARSVDQPADAGQVDHAVAHHPAPGEHVRGGGEPVGYVVAGDSSLGALDQGVEMGVPPDVVGVDHHAHVGGIEALGQLQRLREGHHHGALGDHHRVQGLDAQPHAALDGVRGERLDPLEHLPACGRQVAVGGRPAHQHEHRRAELRGLVHGGAVVRVALAAARGVRGGEEAAAAEARHPEARTPDQLGGTGRELVPPGREPADAGLGAGLDDLLEREVVGGDLVEREARGVDAHGRIPASASRRPMRSTASAGSRSRPAASARRTRSARCTSVRALSAPATIRKCS